MNDYSLHRYDPPGHPISHPQISHLPGTLSRLRGSTKRTTNWFPLWRFNAAALQGAPAKPQAPVCEQWTSPLLASGNRKKYLKKEAKGRDAGGDFLPHYSRRCCSNHSRGPFPEALKCREWPHGARDQTGEYQVGVARLGRADRLPPPSQHRGCSGRVPEGLSRGCPRTTRLRPPPGCRRPSPLGALPPL